VAFGVTDNAQPRAHHHTPIAAAPLVSPNRNMASPPRGGVTPPRRELIIDAANFPPDLRRTVEVRRRPALPPGLTPRLRAAELSRAARDSAWPAKNVSAPRRPSAPVRPPYTATAPPPPPAVDAAGGSPLRRQSALAVLRRLETIADDSAVQQLLYQSVAGHCGTFLPREAQMLIHRAKLKASGQSSPRRRVMAGGGASGSVSARSAAEPGARRGRCRAALSHRGAGESGDLRAGGMFAMLRASPVSAVGEPAPQLWLRQQKQKQQEEEADGRQQRGVSGSEAIRQLAGALAVHPAVWHLQFHQGHLDAIAKLIVRTPTTTPHYFARNPLSRCPNRRNYASCVHRKNGAWCRTYLAGLAALSAGMRWAFSHLPRGGWRHPHPMATKQTSSLNCYSVSITHTHHPWRELMPLWGCRLVCVVVRGWCVLRAARGLWAVDGDPELETAGAKQQAPDMGESTVVVL
jgi:hypothetical protein